MTADRLPRGADLRRGWVLRLDKRVQSPRVWQAFRPGELNSRRFDTWTEAIAWATSTPEVTQ